MKGYTEDNDAEMLRKLFLNKFGKPVENVERLPGAGSARKYYRLRSDEFSCIGTVCDNIVDSRAFVNLSILFRENDVNVPAVYIVSDDFKYYLQQDLGSDSLFDQICRINKSPDAKGELSVTVKATIDQLIKLQSIDRRKIAKCVGYPAFCKRQVMWDLNYFKYEYLKPSGFDFDENALEDDFESFAGELIKITKADTGFMYRDFQSRNIIMKGDEPWFIDYQGGRIGPRIYDIVSFLWQAKAGFSESFRAEMIDYYYKSRDSWESVESRQAVASSDIEFYDAVLKMALFRTLQVLGAYGLRGLVERKAHFIESIPRALENLLELIKVGGADCYPGIKAVCEIICGDPRFNQQQKEGLTVNVFSFSYKKGYPADYTGNGGGFMFDCRGMHNPGRYEEYKPLTGRDAAVIEFLEDKGEVQEFTRKAVEIVSPTVERYIQRGFSNLQVGFGCTGGRHRSVYCAERVAKELATRFPEATVKLVHREQDVIIEKV